MYSSSSSSVMQMVRVLHEQMAVQMLDLMAEAAGGQLLVLHLKQIAVAVLRPDTHRIGARDDAELARGR